MQYFDIEGHKYEDEFSGYLARVIQHEYDHIDGVMFTDHCSPLRKRLLKGKLTDISKGIVTTTYRVKPPRN